MALDDKTFFRVLRNGGLTRQVSQAILDRLAALGGSAPDSHLEAEADGPLVLPQDIATPVTGLTVDSLAGADLEIDVDTTRVRFLTTGTYRIGAVGILNNGVSTSSCEIGMAKSGGTFPAGAGGAEFGNGGVPLTTGNAVPASGVYRISAGALVSFVLTPRGGSGDDGLSFFGLSIFRLV